MRASFVLFCFLPKRESGRPASAKWKNGSPPSIYVSDYKTAGDVIREAYTFCFGAYVRFNTRSRCKLCQGCQVLLPVTSPAVRCWACAIGSFAEKCGGEWHRWCAGSDIACYLPIRKRLTYSMHTIIKGHLYHCVPPACGQQQEEDTCPCKR